MGRLYRDSFRKWAGRKLLQGSDWKLIFQAVIKSAASAACPKTKSRDQAPGSAPRPYFWLFFRIFWCLVPGFVSWVLEIVFWVSGIVFWVSGIVFWVLGFVFWVLGFVFWVLGFVFWVSGLVFWVRWRVPLMSFCDLCCPQK